MEDSVNISEDISSRGASHHVLFRQDPPTQRNVVWEGGIFAIQPPKRLQLIQNDRVGHPYARIHWPNLLVRTFLHQGSMELRESVRLAKLADHRIRCNLKIWQNTYADGTGQCVLDYTPTNSYGTARELSFVPLDWKGVLPDDVGGGELLTFPLPGTTRQILIGNATES